MCVRVLGLSVSFVVMVSVSGLKLARGQEQAAINYPELFQTLDVNDDKIITRGEVPEDARDAFDRLAKLADKNGDGKIDQLEYRDVLVRARDSALSAVPKTSEAFKAADKNGDGKLERDEFTGIRAMFNRADANNDGSLSPDEAIRFRENAAKNRLPQGNEFPPRFATMDKNGDKKLNREEFTGVPANFNRMDVNSDGFVTPAELRQFFSANPNAAKKAQAKKAEKTPQTAK